MIGLIIVAIVALVIIDNVITKRKKKNETTLPRTDDVERPGAGGSADRLNNDRPPTQIQ